MRVLRVLSMFAVAAVVVAACGGGSAVTTLREPLPTTTPAPSTTIPQTSSTTEVPAPTTTESPDTDRGYQQGLEAQFVRFYDSGAMELEVIAPDGGVSGRLLDVELTGLSASLAEQFWAMPCGLLFVPSSYREPLNPDAQAFGEQRMMNLEGGKSWLAPGETWVVRPYVMCIDSGLPAPKAGVAYRIEGIATGELLALAQCVCDDREDDEYGQLDGDLGLQLAVWAASEGRLLTVKDGLANAQGVFGDVLASELELEPDVLQALSELDGLDLESLDLATLGLGDIDPEAVLQQASTFLEGVQADAQEWLDRCGIELNE